MAMQMSHFELGPWDPATLRRLVVESLRYVGVVTMPGGGQAVHAHMSGGQPLSRLPVYRCVVCKRRACTVCITDTGRSCRLISIFLGTTAQGKDLAAVLGEEEPPSPGEEPPDQPILLGYQVDDGGRAAAGFPGRSNDGVVRAIAICGGLDYRDVREVMTAHMKENGYTLAGGPSALRRRQEQQRGGWQDGTLTGKGVEEQVLAHFGFERVSLPGGPRPTYWGAFHTYGDCIVESGPIRCALVGGALRDIEDSRTVRQSGNPRPDGTFARPRLSERKAQGLWKRGRSQTGDP